MEKFDTTSTSRGPFETATQVRQREVAEAAKRKLQTDPKVRATLFRSGCFKTGAHFIVDGQFGSTGKGLMASVYAESGGESIDVVTTNAGPNSGHTTYSPVNGEKIVTRQIPIASVVLRLLGHSHDCHLNAGAVIDPGVLMEELERWRFGLSHFGIHPNAALIEEQDKLAEQSGPVAAIASTGKGVGSALARKIMRAGNTAGLVHGWWSGCVTVEDFAEQAQRSTILVETAQGFSLGINGRFYPNVTSRECTTLQAAADARIPASAFRSVIACYRTLPIRVGNTPIGFSGGHYPDQHELRWEALGLEPELTTVTQRPRRIFSWSRLQFRESIAVNQPTVIFLNFCNYLEDKSLTQLLGWMDDDYAAVMGRDKVPLVLLGYGPYNGDVRLG